MKWTRARMDQMPENWQDLPFRKIGPKHKGIFIPRTQNMRQEEGYIINADGVYEISELEYLDESPAPTSIKTAEEIFDENAFYNGIMDRQNIIQMMQEYKNQPTGDKWNDEELEKMLADFFRYWWNTSGSNTDQAAKDFLSNYKKSTQ